MQYHCSNMMSLHCNIFFFCLSDMNRKKKQTKPAIQNSEIKLCFQIACFDKYELHLK